MKKNYWWLIVVIVFVAGLMFSNMSVQAKEKTPVIQWEYKTVKVNYMRDEYKDKYVKPKYKDTRGRIIEEDLSMLNKLGKDGWELCGVNNINYYFKRVIKED